MRTQNYRQIPSRRAGSLATFRQQMADYVRGQQLEALRKARHLSQEKAAQEVGVSTKTFRAWEKGGAIRWDNAQRVGKFFDVDPESLVTRDLDDNVASLLAPREPATGDDQLDRIEQRLDEAITEVRAAVATLAADNLRLTQALEELRSRDRRKGPKADGAQ